MGLVQDYAKSEPILLVCHLVDDMVAFSESASSKRHTFRYRRFTTLINSSFPVALFPSGLRVARDPGLAASSEALR